MSGIAVKNGDIVENAGGARWRVFDVHETGVLAVALDSLMHNGAAYAGGAREYLDFRDFHPGGLFVVEGKEKP